MEGIKHATCYLDDFDTAAYYRRYRPKSQTLGCKGGTEGIRSYVSGDRLLDVGTGASLVSFVSASRHVKEIHLSDLLPRHLNLLQKWLDGEDMENYIVKYVLEKEKDGKSLKERIADIRMKVRRLMVLDVTQQVHLEEINKAYDIITSSFCFECAAKSIAEYSAVVANVGKLVKPGGYMVLVGVIEESCYIVGEYKFWNANTKEDDVKCALNGAGFNIIFWREMALPANVAEPSDCKGFFVTAAQKM